VRSLIERLRGSGILDDRRYAEGKAVSLRRRGAALGRAGFTYEIARAVIDGEAEET
jgi:hypothetical protein